VPTKRTRAASVAGTSTTCSPAATSCSDSKNPRPPADSQRGVTAVEIHARPTVLESCLRWPARDADPGAARRSAAMSLGVAPSL
jgi:hypothetical protein